MNTHRFFIILFLVIIAAGLIFGLAWYKNNEVSAKEFAGISKGYDSNVLTVEGVYSISDQPASTVVNRKVTVKVVITSETKLIKEVLHLPTIDEVKATGGRYDPSKLKRDEVTGSADDLKEVEASVKIKAASNIYGLDSFTASEIRYIEPSYPD